MTGSPHARTSRASSHGLLRGVRMSGYRPGHVRGGPVTDVDHEIAGMPNGRVSGHPITTVSLREVRGAPWYYGLKRGLRICVAAHFAGARVEVDEIAEDDARIKIAVR